VAVRPLPRPQYGTSERVRERERANQQRKTPNHISTHNQTLSQQTFGVFPFFAPAYIPNKWNQADRNLYAALEKISTPCVQCIPCAHSATEGRNKVETNHTHNIPEKITAEISSYRHASSCQQRANKYRNMVNTWLREV